MLVRRNTSTIELNPSNSMYARFCCNKFGIAGQDTIAIAITWMIKFVDENQEVLNELKVIELFLTFSYLFSTYFLGIHLLNHCGLVIK